MAKHFEQFIAETDSPGVLLISSNRTIGQTIDAWYSANFCVALNTYSQP